MPGQPSLPGFDAVQKPTDSLFFAIFPDADAAARIAELAQRLRGEHGLRGTPLKTERFHVTLHQLGNYAGLPPHIIAMAGEAAAALAMPSFEVAFDRVASFSSAPRNRPFVLRGGSGLAELTAFQQALGMAMGRAGLDRWAKPVYTPHVTLLYDGRSVAEQLIETIRWTAHEFVLVHSLVGQTRYIPLARWPLQPAIPTEKKAEPENR